MEQNNIAPFRVDEITVIRGNPYPKVSGRLRLSHENNETLSITTQIIKYDENIAVVRAECTTSKGIFTGIGMASIDRDKKIAPAILELAETRAIARCLRFSGAGLEYCSAEEVSHLNGNNADDFSEMMQNPVRYNGKHVQPETNHHDMNDPVNGNGNPVNGNAPPVNGNGRVSGKQYKYIMRLLGQNGKSKNELDDYCLNAYGSSLQHLSKNDASNLIEILIEQ